MSETTIVIAFIAGFVSFLSPCVLPIIPGFLAYLAGTSLEESTKHRGEIFLNSLFFVLGFSAVFAVLGVLLNSFFAAFAYDIEVWLARIGGGLIILFGLYLTGLIRVPFLEREYKFKVKFSGEPSRRSRTRLRRGPGFAWNSRYLTSFLFGSAFAAGWTPCVGAVLGGVIALAAVQPGSALVLFFSYSLGLGLPFLAVGLFASQASHIINRYAKQLSYVNKVFGVILIIIGILAFTQNLNLLINIELINRWVL